MPIIAKIKANKDGSFKMPKWMECTWRRVPCGKDNCPLCGRIKKNRQKHIDRGEDPDDLKSVFEDVGNNFKEALMMIKKDAERIGIDITNIDNTKGIKEPPAPKKFPLYRKVSRWRELIEEILKEASMSESLWLETEAADDLMWYRNTLAAKTYRQLCNHWEIENGDDYGDFDYKYTKYVLQECLKILKNSLAYLSLLNSGQKGEFILALNKLQLLESQILRI